MVTKYEELDQKQQELFDDLLDALKESKDISQMLKGAKVANLLPVFTAVRSEKEDEKTKNISFLSKVLDNQEHRSAVFNVVKEKGILREFLGINLHVVKQAFQSVGDGSKVAVVREEYKLADFIAGSGVNMISLLDEIKGTFGLEEFWKASSVMDRNIIKGPLERNMLEDGQDKSKYKGFLEEIKEIEKKIESENDQSKVKKVNKANTGTNYLSVESKATSKAIVAGAIGGVIAGLAVGGGLFAAGASLPILALIGIAVAAAVLTGLIAGGITYEMSKPSNELDEADAQQKVSQTSQVPA